MNKNIFITLSFNKKIDNIQLFINNFKNINYNKENIYLYIISPFYKIYNNFINYKKIFYYEKFSDIILDQSIALFKKYNCDYYYYIDSSVIINNNNILTVLNSEKFQILSPVIYLENSDITNLMITGNIKKKCNNLNNNVNNFDLLNNIVVLNKKIFEYVSSPYIENIFHNINNRNITYNFICDENNNLALIKESNFINFNYDILDNEIYNMDDINSWEDKYLHDEFKNFLNGGNISINEPIPFLFEFPLFNERFCKELITIMEQKNKWSDGGHNDKRLNTGYENVPTVDTHFNQIGFEKQWNKIVFKYIAKIAEKGFVGSHTSSINMSFVVKYTPSGQSNLKPHHDSSLYSAMVALNERGKDFEGGGTRFLRYDYKHLTQKPGYCVIFPGRLTHYHEGLETTKGTRYILVSFIE
jgi:hypothetical protein